MKLQLIEMGGQGQDFGRVGFRGEDAIEIVGPVQDGIQTVGGVAVGGIEGDVDAVRGRRGGEIGFGGQVCGRMKSPEGSASISSAEVKRRRRWASVTVADAAGARIRPVEKVVLTDAAWAALTRTSTMEFRVSIQVSPFRSNEA